MFGYIILRDIPKEEAQLDLSIYEIKGGFRGFAEVEPGLHYVSIKVGDDMHEGFWCYVKPNSVVVKVFDYEKNEFKNDTLENEQQYSAMALSGSMNRALIPVIQRNMEMAFKWKELVSYVKEKVYPVTLNSETPMVPPDNLSAEEMSEWYLKKQKSRFEQAFYDTHHGEVEPFLAELQFAFVSFLIKRDNNKALNRWLHLLQSIYNAGERSIEEAKELFSPLIDVIVKQIDILPNNMLTSDSKILYNVNNLIEDMIDTDIEELKQKGKDFADFLKSKGILS